MHRAATSAGIPFNNFTSKVPSIFPGLYSTKFPSSGPPRCAECFQGGSLRLPSGQSARLCELNAAKIRGSLVVKLLVSVPARSRRAQGPGARRRLALATRIFPKPLRIRAKRAPRGAAGRLRPNWQFMRPVLHPHSMRRLWPGGLVTSRPCSCRTVVRSAAAVGCTVRTAVAKGGRGVGTRGHHGHLVT